MRITNNNFPNFSPFHKVHTVPIYRYVPRVPVSVPSSELGPPPPLSSKRGCPSPEPKGGRGHTRLRVRGVGGPNSDKWRKSPAICLLCAPFWPGTDDLYAGGDEVRAAGALSARPLLRSQTGHPWRSVAGRPWRAVAGRPWRATARRPFQLVRKSVVLRPRLLLTVFYQLLVSVRRWLLILIRATCIRILWGNHGGMSSFCDKMRARPGDISYSFRRMLIRSGRWCIGGLRSTFSFRIPE